MIEDFVTGHPALPWLAAGLALLVLEALAPGVFMMWLGLAALGTGFAVLVADLHFGWQVAVFGVLAILAITVGVRVPRRMAAHPVLNTAASGLVGRTARVLSFDGPEGRVRVGDSDWPARVAPGTPAPAPGAHLRVRAVDGTCLVLESAG